MTSLKQSKPVIVFIIIFLMIALCVPRASAVPVLDPDIPYIADAEQPIDIFVNITSDLPINEVLLTYENPSNGLLNIEYMNMTSGSETNGTWHFAIPSQTYKGSLDLWVQASDISGASTRYPSTGSYDIELEGPEPSKPFPWNIVVIVAFLAVVLIATELIFKPGFYRPTGRQRAEALEKEDRERELEEGSGSGKNL